VISGVVVMPLNESYIVDLDDRDNLHVGDILTVVDPGRKIFHPVTKEVIGSVDEPLGFLQVTRIHSGYSYTKVLTEGLKPENGAPVKRFEQVPAVLSDDGQHAELVQQVRTNLPQFAWQDPSAAETALVRFTVDEDALVVADREGLVLHRYGIIDGSQLVSTQAATPRPTLTPAAKPEPRALQRFANSLMGTVTTTNEERFAEIDQAILRSKQADGQGIWMGPNLAGHPVGMAVGDLDGDGRQEIAVALDHSIVLSRVVDGAFEQLAELDLSIGLQLLSIDALDLDANGQDELYVSAISNYWPASFVVEYDGGNLNRVIDNVRWLLRATKLSDQEQPILIGQKIARTASVYDGEVFAVRREGDQLIEGESLGLPEKLNLFNFLPFSDDKGLHYLYLTEGDYLKVISATGVDLWGSDDYYGGSETCFTSREERSSETLIPTCTQLSMILLPNNEILVGRNDGQRMVQRYRRFKRSRVVSLSWNGFALIENWQTASQPGYLGDFALADADNDGTDELVMAVKFKHKGLTDKARSSIVIYELK
ncbi:MAG: VCBS repeat-containing protein, partial [Desulfuromonadales bacterium]